MCSVAPVSAIKVILSKTILLYFKELPDLLEVLVASTFGVLIDDLLLAACFLNPENDDLPSLLYG